MTEDERKEYERKASRYNTEEHVHTPIVLEDGITDIKILSFPPKDLEWLEQRKMSRDEVGAIFGVPDEIMGYGRDTYENFATAEKVLWTLTIVPIVGLRDGTLTRFFRKVRLLSPAERISSDFSAIPQLQEDTIPAHPDREFCTSSARLYQALPDDVVSSGHIRQDGSAYCAPTHLRRPNNQ